jgi:hypothetical protein
MKGYWQRHLDTIGSEPGLLDRLGAEEDYDADAVAAAREIGAGDGRMSREDVAKAFGEEAAEKAFGPEPKPSRRRHRRRAPFAPRKPSGRPEPWSELKKPAGLPSFRP